MLQDGDSAEGQVVGCLGGVGLGLVVVAAAAMMSRFANGQCGHRKLTKLGKVGM